MKNAALSLLLVFSLLAGCGTPTKEEMVQKTEHVKTTDELRSVLGSPDKYDVSDLPVVGKVETFVYKGSDGEMTFIAHNGKIHGRVSGGDGKR